MCGIIAFVDLEKKISKTELDLATDTMILRGPDARGTLLVEESNYNIGLGHRRLAILDLDERSNQPFIFEHFSMVYNGEVYNFEEIKGELTQLGHNFKTTSDTEVILKAYLEWGEDCFHKFIGMFAFCIYDSIKKEFVIVRDRLGVKPLYIFNDAQKVIIASELKAILPLLSTLPSIDESSLLGFFSLGYVPGEASIFKDIKKVKPGLIIKIDFSEEVKINQKEFWNINKLSTNDIEGNNKHRALSGLLEDSIRLRAIADVEVGSYLSGGLDSSYVTKVLNDLQSKSQIKSFTIGFNASFDEAPHAKKVADFIGTDHYSYYLNPKDVEDIIHDYATYFDEPFSDDAAIPLLFLSRKAKQEVKVAISSDGGDEVFAGYSRYLKVLKINEVLNRYPKPLLLFFKKLSKFLLPILPKHFKISTYIFRLSKCIDKDQNIQLANLLFHADSVPEPQLKRILTSDLFNFSVKDNYFKTSKGLTPLKQLLAIDIGERLVNQMLVKVDKSTMGASLEGREPLLDHRLFEIMTHLDDDDLISGKTTKYIFRKIIRDKFKDSDILNKPKMGFSTPLYNWLKEYYSTFVEEQFKSVESLSIPHLKQNELLAIWNEFKNGKVYYQNLIWRSLVYILWYKKYCIIDRP